VVGYSSFSRFFASISQNSVREVWVVIQPRSTNLLIFGARALT